MDVRYENVEESYPTTFNWIFRPTMKTTQYAEGRRWDDFGTWLQHGKGLYWVNGKAGSGKSTLMKYIVEHKQTSRFLTQWAGNTTLCTGIFFFWNSGTKEQRSQRGLLRSLLYEIWCKHPELIPTVLPSQWSTRYTTKIRGYPTRVSSIHFVPHNS